MAAASAVVPPSAEDVDDPDAFRILIATDNHVGYNEKDKVRGNDALNSFEEILQIAKDRGVDFVLHGGDLFHENKPSRGCLYRTMDMMRRHLLGPGDVGFQVVSDPSLFSRGMVNYEDANVNVEIPMFMIHGNHDDPGGESNLSAASLLEVASLVNYFGRSEDLEDIVIRPILLKKGRTNLAIYGLGNIRDERLHRAFQARKVRFETPANPEQWFNIMILHQNRHKGNKGGVPTKACVHEQMLPSFLDLVIWGHEHDCEVSPQESLRGEFYVVQPGSSVATSLAAGEAQLKHVAIIDVKQGVFRCTPVPLWTVRPLVMKDVSLSESGLLRTDTQAIWNALNNDIEALIAEGNAECQRRKREMTERSGGRAGPQAPMLPLVRLRVEHSGFETVNTQAFGQQFADRVANPDELLLFHRRGGGAASGSGGGGGAANNRKLPVPDNLEIEEGPANGEDGPKIQDIIYKYIEGEQGLAILPEPDLNDAVQSFVHRAEPCAIAKFVEEVVAATNNAVLRESRALGEEEIRVQIQDRAETARRSRLAGVSASGASLPPADSALPPGAMEVKEPAEPKLEPEFGLGGGGTSRFARGESAAAQAAEAFGGGGFGGLGNLPQGRSGAIAANNLDLDPAELNASQGRGRGRGRKGGGKGRGRGGRGAAASQAAQAPVTVPPGAGRPPAPAAFASAFKRNLDAAFGGGESAAAAPAGTAAAAAGSSSKVARSGAAPAAGTLGTFGDAGAGAAGGSSLARPGLAPPAVSTGFMGKPGVGAETLWADTGMAGGTAMDPGVGGGGGSQAQAPAARRKWALK